MVLLITARYICGWSLGLVLVNVGGLGRSWGSWPWARVMAACTSVAAASMLLSRLNWSVKLVLPWPLLLVTSSRPGIYRNCRSSGVATLLAIVSGVAPG